MSAFLNGDTTDLFYAHIVRSSGGPLMFMVNPNEVESVTLRNKVSARGYGKQGRARLPVSATGPEARTADERRSHQAGGRRELRDRSVIASYRHRRPGLLRIREAADRRGTPPWGHGWPSGSSRSSRSTQRVGKVASPRRCSAARRVLSSGSGSTARSIRAMCVPCRPTIMAISSIGMATSSLSIPSVAWYPMSLEGRSLAKFDLTFNTVHSLCPRERGRPDRLDADRKNRADPLGHPWAAFATPRSIWGSSKTTMCTRMARRR